MRRDGRGHREAHEKPQRVRRAHKKPQRAQREHTAIPAQFMVGMLRGRALVNRSTSMPTALDLDFVRRQFPALDGSFIYLDNAGGSQTLGRVVDRISDYLLHTNVQLGATYAVSQTAAARVAEGIAAVRTWLNAADTSEIALGASTTQLFANLAHAM